MVCPGFFSSRITRNRCQFQCTLDQYMDYGCCLIASPLTLCLRIPGSSSKLEMGIRDWYSIQSAGVHPNRPTHGRIVCNLFLLSLLFIDYPERMYFRHEGKVVSVKRTGLRNRIESLIGITGFQSARKDPTWAEVCIAPLRVVWRPQLFLILIFEVRLHEKLLLS